MPLVALDTLFPLSGGGGGGCNSVNGSATIFAQLEVDFSRSYLDHPLRDLDVIIPYENKRIVWYPYFTLFIFAGGGSPYTSYAEKARPPATPASVCLNEPVVTPLAGSVPVTDYFGSDMPLNLYRFDDPPPPAIPALEEHFYLVPLPSGTTGTLKVIEVGKSIVNTRGAIVGCPTKGQAWANDVNGWKETAWSNPAITGGISCPVAWSQTGRKINDKGVEVGEHPSLYGKGTLHPLKMASVKSELYKGGDLPAICRAGYWLRNVTKVQLQLRVGATFISPNCGTTVVPPIDAVLDFDLPAYQECKGSDISANSNDVTFNFTYSHDA